MRLQQRQSTSPSTLTLSQQTEPLLARIFAARGIQSMDEVVGTLSQLHPVSQLGQVTQAADLISQHIHRQSRILIIGDFDVDGATATALFMRGFGLLGYPNDKVSFLVPNRFEFAYGLSPELVEEAKKWQPHLLITVDNGIANHDGVAAAKQYGWDVIITDHHLPRETLPNADVIVNPNCVDNDFPSKNLAGVGVAFYVLLALKKTLQAQGWFDQFNQKALPNLTQLLDLVALGTVADVVPLDRNNRILVEHGLKQIRQQQSCVGIQALFEVAGKNFQQAVASDLSFACAPRLNAAGRLDDITVGIHCLLTDDFNQARMYAKQLNDYNQERKIIEATMKDQALNTLAQLDQTLQANQQALPPILCLYDESWHQGVVGILASRIKEQYHRPCIIFANSNETAESPTQNELEQPSSVQIKGSARSVEGIHIRDLLAEINRRYPDLIPMFGGHAMAAGLTLDRVDFSRFKQILEAVAQAYCHEDCLTESLYTDGALHAEELTLKVAEMLRYAAPWGQHFPEPLFDGHFIIQRKTVLKEKHLRLELSPVSDTASNKPPNNTNRVQGIIFNTDVTQWPSEQAQVHLLYQFDVNEFRGHRSPQLMIKKRL